MKQTKIIFATIVAFISISVGIISCTKERQEEVIQSPPKEVNAQKYSSNYSDLGLDISQHGDYIQNNPSLVDIVFGPYVAYGLSQDSLSINDDSLYTKLVDQNSGKTAFAISLNSPDSNTKAGLIIYRYDDSALGIYEMYVVKTVTNGNSKTTYMKSIGHPFEEIDSPGDSANRPYRDFKSCMIAAWHAITDDLAGTIACALNPDICLAACLIHCAIASATVACDNPTPTQAEALQCLCSLHIIKCDVTVAQNAYRFTSKY
ncbi:MAG: hypothetical protein IAE95_06135 [Chitinophagaceae bacterium]|nr:hypothetical protein [Chitinophagaceae bacterium]